MTPQPTNEGGSEAWKYSIEVRYDKRNVALVKLSAYKKLLARCEAMEKMLKAIAQISSNNPPMLKHHYRIVVTAKKEG